MQRRDFLKSGVALAVAAGLGTNKALGIVPAHNWGGSDGLR
ncbi:MAG: twin-arginine translocation signal domain-containing protein [Terriglobales bacterium]